MEMVSTPRPLCQKLRRPVRGDHHVVFTAHPEFTGYVDPRLIRKGHARLEDGLASAHEIRMLLPVQPNPLPQPVREKLVVWPMPGVGDHLACGVIDRPR